MTKQFITSSLYEVKCNDYDSYYIDQTGRRFLDGYKEHIKAISNQTQSNIMPDHLLNENCSYSKLKNT